MLRPQIRDLLQDVVQLRPELGGAGGGTLVPGALGGGGTRGWQLLQHLVEYLVVGLQNGAHVDHLCL